MANVRNYGVGTGYSSSGITGKKSTFAYDAKIYACHVWDELQGGEPFRIEFAREVSGSWQRVYFATWTNPSYSSAYQYAWIKNHPSGKYRASFWAGTEGPYRTYFTVNPAPAPPEPPAPPPVIPEETTIFWINQGYTIGEAIVIVGWIVINKQSPTQETINQILIDAGLREPPTPPPEPPPPEPEPEPVPEATTQFWIDLNFAPLDAEKIAEWVKTNQQSPTDETIEQILGSMNEYDIYRRAILALIKAVEEGAFKDASKAVLTLVNFKLVAPDGSEIQAGTIPITPAGALSVSPEIIAKLGPKLSFFGRLGQAIKNISLTKKIVAGISLIGGILGFDAWSDWSIIDNLAFQVWQGANAVAQSYDAGEISKEDALAEIDRLLKLAEAGYEKVRISSLVNPLVRFLAPQWDDIALLTVNNLNALRTELLAAEPVPGKGRLILRPDPTDSKVSVEGQIPSTGIFNQELDIGVYTFTVSKFGYISQSGSAEIQEGLTTEANIKLEKEVDEEIPPEEIEGTLVISAIPEDSIITVAGEDHITGPGTYPLAPGSYGVKAEREGFVSQTRTAFINEREETKIAFTLKEIPPPEVEPPIIPPVIPTDATITITSEPTNADVYINGAYRFTTTPYTIVLTPGNYIIRVQKEGYFPLEQVVEIEESEVSDLPFTLEIIPPDAPPQPPYIPYSPVYPSGYETLYPAPSAPAFYETPRPAAEKELLVNIETTDVKPWNGRIFSIAYQDLSIPGSEPVVLMNENEQLLLQEFMNIFNQIAPSKLVGFKLTFDHRYIFAKLMRYRMQNKAWPEIDMKDVKQILDQVKEEFVYFPDKTGTLDAWGKHLLGRGKYGPQEGLLREFLAKNFEYVSNFQKRQLEVTKGLYDLTRFSSSESLITPIPGIPVISPSPQTSINPPSLSQSGQKQCDNCLAFNPLDATQCLVCGSTRFK